MEVVTITQIEYDAATEQEKKEVQTQLASGQLKIQGVEILPSDALSWDRTEEEKRIFLNKLCQGKIMVLSDQWDDE